MTINWLFRSRILTFRLMMLLLLMVLTMMMMMISSWFIRLHFFPVQFLQIKVWCFINTASVSMHNNLSFFYIYSGYIIFGGTVTSLEYPRID